MSRFTGMAASPGCVLGTAVLHAPMEIIPLDRPYTSPEEERRRFSAAVTGAGEELNALKNGLGAKLGEEMAHIFRAQITMVEDEEFFNEVMEASVRESLCCDKALERVFKEYSLLFTQMGEDDYNRQRVQDLSDVCRRLQRHLQGIPEEGLERLPPGSIIVAEDLLPSDTAGMDKEHVAGLVCQEGGVTSHVAILAKSLEIPAAVRVEGILQAVKGESLYLDARDLDTARLRVNPGEAELPLLRLEAERYSQSREALKELACEDSVTLDGTRIQLSVNIGGPADFEAARTFSAESVGLLRTEFLFLDKKTLPDEEEQYRFYSRVARELSPGMVVIRTLDIGGDKDVPALGLPKEENPFLGVRGVRLCLERRELFRTQLRAILRAAHEGNIKVMFPMVAGMEEWREAREAFHQAADELAAERIPHNREIDLGVMIETPGAVLLAEKLAGECGFFSIGTNDLTQYLLSADRNNPRVAGYYRQFSPALFLAVKAAAKAIESHGWCGVCGELGGHPYALPVLLGLGVRELSMSAQSLPRAIGIIRRLTMEGCVKMAETVISLDTEEEIKKYLKHELDPLLGGIV